jgi:hypothetical protein
MASRVESSDGERSQAITRLKDEGGADPIRGSERLAEEKVQPANGTSASLLDPTIEEVERLFAEKAIEAMEISSILNAWSRLEGFERREDDPTEIDRFVESTRTMLEDRLTEFAGTPEDAASKLDRLRENLKRLHDLHGALLDHAIETGSILGNRCVDRLQAAQGLPAGSQEGWARAAMRVESLFSTLGIELGPPVITAAGKMGFSGGASGMGGGFGGGFQ